MGRDDRGNHLLLADLRPQADPVLDVSLTVADGSAAATHRGEAGEAHDRDAARRRDQGENTSTEASCSKMFATEMCGRVADRCVQIHGGAGYISEYSIERFYRDVRLFRLYEGTSQIQQIIIAKNMINQVKD